MHITSGSMTSLVDTLEAKGLLQRFPDPADRRRVLLDITPAGEDVLDEVLPKVIVRGGQVAEVLTDAEIDALLDLLDRVITRARDLPPPVAPKGRRTPAVLRPPRGPDGRRLPAAGPER